MATYGTENGKYMPGNYWARVFWARVLRSGCPRREGDLHLRISLNRPSSNFAETKLASTVTRLPFLLSSMVMPLSGSMESGRKPGMVVAIPDFLFPGLA